MLVMEMISQDPELIGNVQLIQKELSDFNISQEEINAILKMNEYVLEETKDRLLTLRNIE